MTTVNLEHRLGSQKSSAFISSSTVERVRSHLKTSTSVDHTSTDDGVNGTCFCLGMSDTIAGSSSTARDIQHCILEHLETSASKGLQEISLMDNSGIHLVVFGNVCWREWKCMAKLLFHFRRCLWRFCTLGNVDIRVTLLRSLEQRGRCEFLYRLLHRPRYE